MKRTLISCLLLFVTNLLFSQSLAVSGNSIVYGDSSDIFIESHLQVVNNSNSTVIVYCQKNEILMDTIGSSDLPPTNPTSAFCWGGTCYPSTIIFSTEADTILPGEKNTEFIGDYQPWGHPTTAQVEYCFYLNFSIHLSVLPELYLVQLVH